MNAGMTEGKTGEGRSDGEGRISDRAILNALPEPVIVVDGQDNIVTVNLAGEQFFKASEATLRGQNIQDMIPHDSPLLSLVGKVRRSGSSMTEYGVRLSTPKIGGHHVSIDAAPLGDPGDGHVVLTLQKQSIAEKIDDLLTQRGAARSVSAMSSMLAHEVKNPLSGIRGAAQLLESIIQPEDRQLTRLIIEETDRIVGLVDRMEIFSDRPALSRRPVNIHEVLDHVLRLAKAGFARNIRIVERYDPSLPSVYGNRDQLIQIFLNLIKNAAEAVEEGTGEITVSTSYRQGVRLAVPGMESRLHLPLVVSIQDNGPGIPEDIRRNLFDPFITTKKEGTGLGLALVAKFVSEHGGVIDVESEPRHTVFNVLLPMVRDAAEYEADGVAAND